MIGLKIENMDFTKSSLEAFELVWNTNIMPLNLYRTDGSVKFLDVKPDPFYEGKENIRLEVTKWPHLDETSDIVKRAGATYVMNVTVDKDRDDEGGGTDPEPKPITITDFAYDHKTNTLSGKATNTDKVTLSATADLDETEVPVVAGKFTYTPAVVLQANVVVSAKAGEVEADLNITPLFLRASGKILGWDSEIELANNQNNVQFSVTLDGQVYTPTTQNWTVTGNDKFTIDATGKLTAAGFTAGETANIEVSVVADGHRTNSRVVVTRAA